MNAASIQFAMNYSLQAANLVEQAMIEIDRFKCPGGRFLDSHPNLLVEAARLRPVAVHFDLNVGNQSMSHQEWAKIERLLYDTQTPYVNAHIVAFSHDYPTMSVDHPTHSECEFLRDAIIKDLEILVQRFGVERVIAENAPYTPGQKILRATVEPDLISQVIQATGVGFLFDLGHARISAKSLEMSEKDYIDALPMQHLREMHIAGVQPIDNVLRDHLPMTPADWQLLESALENIHQALWPAPWMAALEYGGIGEAFSWRSDQEVMQSQVPEIYRMLKSTNPVS